MKTKRFTTCQILRTKETRAGALNPSVGPMQVSHNGKITEPCSVLLLDEREQLTGACNACHAGAETEGNTFASPGEKKKAERATLAPTAPASVRLTPPQTKALLQLPGDGAWGIPRSTTHNGTLATLIQHGLVEWSGGKVGSVWQLNHGQFKLTAQGLDVRQQLNAKPRPRGRPRHAARSATTEASDA